MSVFYLDASAWVKRYVEEGGSFWIYELFRSQTRLASVTLGYVEAVAALGRRLSDPEWVRVEVQLRVDWQNMMQLETSGTIIERAVILARRYKLRGADAVHLAAALDLHQVLAEISELLVFVASDEELLSAAQKTGLQIENPLTASVRPMIHGQ